MSRKFSGVYAPYIEQYIDVRRELGFKCELEEDIFFLFDRFTIERGETNVGITKELADNWNIKPPNESDSYRYRRALTIRQLASFLCQIGIRSYIPQLPTFKSTFTPYIFSKTEINALFKAVDELRGKKKA